MTFDDSNMYSLATHQNPNPNTMFTKVQKCINAKELYKHTKARCSNLKSSKMISDPHQRNIEPHPSNK